MAGAGRRGRGRVPVRAARQLPARLRPARLRSALLLTLSCLAALLPAAGRAQGELNRLPDGRPDLSGNWSIAVSISDISANLVRIDGEPVADDARVIPYTPVYAALRAEAEARMFEEPELHCYMSGVPSHLWRQAYSGAGLVIQQTGREIVFLHEFQGSRRIVSLTRREHIPAAISLFMGDGIGHWEGDTLVIETSNNNALTWLDTVGNRHSGRLVVTERFTPVDNDHWEYEATFVDADAYTRPWTIAAPMTRGPDPEAEILEFACVEGNTDHLHYTEDVGGTSLAAPSPAPESFDAPAQSGRAGSAPPSLQQPAGGTSR